MAGVITNVINTVFTSKGAKKVERETEAIGRAQTRLGQSSASAGRTFAAQSQGLGGLVAAYAGAAATIFAVSAAFDALSKAAAAENIVKGTNVLAASVGQVGPQLIASIKEITNNQVTLAEAAQNANIALSTGFSSKQILGLTDVANKAARTLGRDLTDAFQRLVRGTSKLEPELLDELGIFVRLDPAVKAYAEQLGKAANELNEFERRQAFANAAIEEGNRKFGIIDTGAKSTQKSLEQLRVKVSELFTEFLQVISKALIPLVDFLNNNLGAALAAFGLLAKSVFSKAAQEAAIAAASMGASFGRFADKSLDFLFPINTADFEKRALQLNKTLEDSKNKAAFRTKPYSGQSAAQFEAFNKAITAQRTGAANTLSTLRQVTIEYEKQLAAIRAANKNRKGTTLQERILQRQINENNKTLKEASSVGVGARNAVTTIGATVTSVASFVGRLASRIFFITTAVQFFLSIFGIDVFSAIAKFFSKIGEEAEKANQAIVSLVDSFSGGDLQAEVKILTPDLSVEDLGEKIKSIEESITSRVAGRQAQIEGLRAAGNENAAKNRQELTREMAILERIEKTREKIKDLGSSANNADTRNELKVELAILSEMLGVVREFGDISKDVRITIVDLSKSTGIAGKELIDSVKASNGKLASISEEYLNILGLTITSYDNLSASAKRYAIAGTSSLNTLRSANDSYAAGALSAEQLGKMVAGLSEQYLALATNAEGAQEALETLGVDPALAAAVITNAVKDLSKELDTLRELEKFLSKIAEDIENVKSTFSKEIDVSNSSIWDGVTDAFGMIAKSEEQIRNNQVDQLINTLQTYRVDKSILDSLDKKLDLTNNLTDEQRVLTDAEKDARDKRKAYNIALEASKGLIISSAIELDKIIQKQKQERSQLEEKNRLRREEFLLLRETNKAQLKNLRDELALEEQRRDIEASNNRADLIAASRSLNLARAEILGDIEKDTYAKLDSFTKNLIEARRAIVLDDVSNLAKITSSEGIREAATNYAKALEKGGKAQKELILLDKELLMVEQAARKEAFHAETELLREELRVKMRVNLAEEDRVKREEQLALSKLVAEENRIKFETDVLVKQVELIKQRAKIVQAEIDGINTMGQHVVNFGSIVNTMGINLAAFTKAQAEGTTFQAQPVTTYAVNRVNTDAITQVNGLAATAIKEIAATQTARLEGIAIERQTIAENTKARLAELRLERDALQKQTEDLVESRKNDFQILLRENEEEIVALENKLINLGTAAAEASDGVDKIKETLLSIFDGIQGAIKTSLTGVKDYIIFGEGNLRDVFVNLFRSIGDTLFEEGFAKPLSESLTAMIMGTTREGLEERGASAANPLWVDFAGNASSLFKDVLGRKEEGPAGEVERATGGFFERLKNFFKPKAVKDDPVNKFTEATGGFFQNLKNGFNNTFGFIKNILSGFGSFAGNIFKGIFSFIGGLFGASAAGGAVHRAGGGAIPQFAAGGGLRDRVPTLLEPGEFVLRRMAAGAIGMPALQQMNATGQMPGNGSAPVINFKNEGTPKDMEASQPRFDGEKYVIDIITRDLQNNGPIRKTLRGGL